MSKRVSRLVTLFEKGGFDSRIQDMPEANFDVDIQNVVHLYAIEDSLDSELQGIAERLNTSSEKLVERWVKEKVRKMSRESTFQLPPARNRRAL